MNHRAARLAVAVVAVLVTSCAGGDSPPAPRESYLPDLAGVQGTKEFGDPSALAFAANGDLWVGNYESSTLARYRPDQIAAYGVPRAATVIEGGAVKGPNAMVFDAHGYLWVAMQDGDRIAGFTPQDLEAGRPPSVVLPDPDHVLREPAGVALDGEGNLWVSNAAVGNLVRYPRRGIEAGTAKPDVVAEVANDDCQGVAVQGRRLWLGCSDTDVVYAYDLPLRSGRPAFRTRLDWSGPKACGPVQLVLAPGDLVAAACYRSSSVALFGARGKPVEEGRVFAQSMNNVHGIAYDSSGALWVGTNLNVVARYPTGPGRRAIPDVVLRPRPEAVPTVTTRPVGDL